MFVSARPVPGRGRRATRALALVRPRSSLFAPAALAALVAAGPACTYRFDDARAGDDARAPSDVPARAPEAPAAAAPAVSRFHDLLVVDEAVLRSPEADESRPAARLSFGHVLRRLADDGAGRTDDEPAARLAAAWLEAWARDAAVGSDAVPPRPGAVGRLLDPWRGDGALPALDRTPFRLLAVVNRLDLRDDPAGCAGRAGEVRLVYAGVDAASGRSLPLSIIVEIPYPAARSAGAVAERWLGLSRQGGGAGFDAAFVAGLADLVDEALRAAAPGEVALRTNEAALGGEGDDGAWELRELRVVETARGRVLAPVALDQTPRLAFRGTAALDAWLEANAERVQRGDHVLPEALRAGAARLASPTFTWTPSRAPEPLRARFAARTCNGCHGGERGEGPRGGDLAFQHVAPGDGGYAGTGPAVRRPTVLSRWLHDPEGGADELGRREADLAALVAASRRCGERAAGAEPARPYGGVCR